MNDKWQDNLRSRMEYHEESAPEGLWEGIEQQLSYSKKRRLFGISVGAVAAVAVILLFLLINIGDENQGTNKFNEKVVAEIKEFTKPLDDITKENRVSDVKLAETAIRSKESKKTTPNNNFKAEKISDEIKTDSQLTPKEAAEERVDEVAKEDFSYDNSTKKEATKEFSTENSQLFASSTRLKDQKKPRWQTNISMSNTSSGSSETYSGYGTFAVEQTVEEQYAFLSQYTREEVYTDVKHNQPITFALTLRYNLNNRWSVSSGLTYSILTSHLHSASNNYYYDDKQTLHYIGVPLNLAYTFWQNNKLNTYISAGGLVEKNIAGKLISNYYLDNELEISTNKKINFSQLQWSVNSAVGIEYRISDLFGIYAEPGIVYYFNNNSEVETIYKDQPFNFNLRVGLRFNFGD